MATTHSSRSKTCNAYAKRFQQLKADLAQIEYFSKGTLLARMVRCGKPQCACAKDPSKRHGPYYEWSYKARGKTVTVRLAAEAAPVFRAAALSLLNQQTCPQTTDETTAGAYACGATPDFRASSRLWSWSHWRCSCTPGTP